MKKTFSVIALVKEVWPTVYSELKAFSISSQNVARHACKGNEPYIYIHVYIRLKEEGLHLQKMRRKAG